LSTRASVSGDDSAVLMGTEWRPEPHRAPRPRPCYLVLRH